MFGKLIAVSAAMILLGTAASADARHFQGHRYAHGWGDVFLNEVADRALRDTPVDVNFVWGQGNGDGNEVVVPGKPGKDYTVNLLRGSGNGKRNRISVPSGRRRTFTVIRDSINGVDNAVIQQQGSPGVPNRAHHGFSGRGRRVR